MWVNIDKVDIYAGMRDTQLEISGPHVSDAERRERMEAIEMERQKERSAKGIFMRIVTACI